jgi:hypothetical protein
MEWLFYAAGVFSGVVGCGFTKYLTLRSFRKRGLSNRPAERKPLDLTIFTAPED